LDHNRIDHLFLRHPGLQFGRYGSSLFLAQVRYFFHLSNPLEIASPPGFLITLKETFLKFFFPNCFTGIGCLSFLFFL